MANVTIILGLCGSGKTYLAEKLTAETGAMLFENLLSDASNFPGVLECLRNGKDCIIDEVQFCIPANQSALTQMFSEFAGLTVKWICYENDIESANWNVLLRKNKGDPEGHLDINRRLAPLYKYPVGAEVIPIQRI